MLKERNLEALLWIQDHLKAATLKRIPLQEKKSLKNEICNSVPIFIHQGKRRPVIGQSYGNSWKRNQQDKILQCIRNCLNLIIKAYLLEEDTIFHLSTIVDFYFKTKWAMGHFCKMEFFLIIFYYYVISIFEILFIMFFLILTQYYWGMVQGKSCESLNNLYDLSNAIFLILM